MPKPTLLPCPFCGGEVLIEETVNIRNWYGVVCRNTINLGGTCAIQQVPSASKEAAVERWNRRASPAGAQGIPVSAETIRNHIAVTMQDWSKVYQTPQFREDLRMAILSMKPLYLDPPAASEDAARLNEIAAQSWKLEPFDMPTGAGDADIGWRVIEYIGPGQAERIVAEVYRDDPRAAIDAARDGEGVGR